jgi:hypothetical protein
MKTMQVGQSLRNPARMKLWSPTSGIANRHDRGNPTARQDSYSAANQSRHRAGPKSRRGGRFNAVVDSIGARAIHLAASSARSGRRVECPLSPKALPLSLRAVPRKRLSPRLDPSLPGTFRLRLRSGIVAVIASSSLRRHLNGTLFATDASSDRCHVVLRPAQSWRTIASYWLIQCEPRDARIGI